MAISELYYGNAIANNITRVYLGNTLIFDRQTYSDEVQTLLNQAAIDGYVVPSEVVLGYLDTFIESLKTAGIWNLLDVCWLPATDGDSDFACYNIKNPTVSKLSKVNSPIFTSLEGFRGDGVSAYLDTNYNPSTFGGSFTQNNAGMGGYFRIASTVTATYIGAVRSDNINDQTVINITTTNINGRVNSSPINDNKVPNTPAFVHAKRTSNSALSIYRNGVFTDNATNTSIVPNLPWTLLTARTGVSTVSSARNNGQISFAWGGASLDGLEVSFYNAIQTYMTSIGKQI